MLRKEAWFGTHLGTHLRIQNHKKFKFSGRDILPVTVKGLILTQKICSILYSVPRVTITYTKNLNISTKKIYSILYSVPCDNYYIYKKSKHLNEQNIFHIVLCTACNYCLLYTSPSPRDGLLSRMPSSA